MRKYMRNVYRSGLAICLFLLILPWCTVEAGKSTDSKVFKADLIVYGGTSAAVIAAVEMVQSGKSVIVVSPDSHLGGLSSGGLGFTIPEINQLSAD